MLVIPELQKLRSSNAQYLPILTIVGSMGQQFLGMSRKKYINIWKP